MKLQDYFYDRHSKTKQVNFVTNYESCSPDGAISQVAGNLRPSNSDDVVDQGFAGRSFSCLVQGILLSFQDTYSTGYETRLYFSISIIFSLGFSFISHFTLTSNPG